MSRKLVIFSGGMDSATLLWKLLSENNSIDAITFDYGQRHRQEIEYACKMIEYIRSKGITINHDIIDVRSVFSHINSSSLTNASIDVPDCGYTEESAKITVVPNRNQILLSIAVGIAAARKIDNVMYAAHSGDHCLPSTTSILTKRGIINIQDIIPLNDEVLSRNSEGYLEWKLVLDKIENGTPTSLLSIRTKSGAVLRCTNEHKIYNIKRSNWTRRCGWKKETIINPAKELTNENTLCIPYSDIEIPNIVSKTDIIDLYSLISDKTNMTVNSNNDKIRAGNGNWVNKFVSLEDYIKLVCWYVTEGNYHIGNINNPNRFGIYISQSEHINPINCSEIKECIIRWGFEPHIHGIDGKTAIYFSGATTSILTQCGMNSYEKQLPEEWLCYPNNILSIILETLVKGDGHRVSDTHITYSTVSKILYRQIEYIATRLGYRVSHRCSKSNPNCITISMIKAISKPNLNKVVGLSLDNIDKISSIGNNEKVYDLTVQDNHNFFAGDEGWLLVSNSIYPDCRPDFLSSLNETTRISTLWHPVQIEAPFIHISKTDIVRIGLDLGVPYELTRSCYNKGVPCGTCPTCRERLEAFELNGVIDPAQP